MIKKEAYIFKRGREEITDIVREVNICVLIV